MRVINYSFRTVIESEQSIDTMTTKIAFVITGSKIELD